MYAYKAAIYCDECGEAIRDDLMEAGAPDTGDTNDYPQWGEDEATDRPEHCDNCGCLVHDQLTKEGIRYVAQSLVDDEGDPDVLILWAEVFFPGVGPFDPDEQAAVQEWAENLGDPVEALETFADAYLGEMSALDYAYQYIDESGILGNANELARRYFDYEAFARDLVLGGDVTECGRFLFSNV